MRTTRGGSPVSVVTLCMALALGADDHGYLCQPFYATDEEIRKPLRPYQPEPGDLYFSSTKALWSRAGHWLAGSGCPHHSGIVFRRPDGRMAILEAGPFNGLHVETLDVIDDLGGHEKRNEIVWIRHRRAPLTDEQSKSLTEWALAQEGKRFAACRLVGQLTLFRSRGPLRTWFMGGPHGARDSYYCCELVMESLVHIGVCDPERTRPCATYPRDIFFDSSPNPFIDRNLNLSPNWYPPARWVGSNQ